MQGKEDPKMVTSEVAHILVQRAWSTVMVSRYEFLVKDIPEIRGLEGIWLFHWINMASKIW